MKTLKISLVAVVLSFLVVSVASAGISKPVNDSKKVVYLTLIQAIQDPSLVKAMYQQLNVGFLSVQRLVYSQSISFQGYSYVISGTYDQWATFFRHMKIVSIEVKPAIGSVIGNQ